MNPSGWLVGLRLDGVRDQRRDLGSYVQLVEIAGF
jgi:hypothetical protein